MLLVFNAARIAHNVSPNVLICSIKLLKILSKLEDFQYQRYSLRIPPLQTLFEVLKGGVFLKKIDIAFEGGVSLEIFIQKTPNILNSINLFFLGLSPSQNFFS